MSQEQQLQQLQLQLRQLELQLQLHQQQLQEPWATQPSNVQQQESQSSQQPDPAQQNQQSQQSVSQQQDSQQGAEQQPKPTPLYFTPPQMVSLQDISYIQNLLNLNLLAVKQYRQAAQNCQLPDLKVQFKEASQMHLEHMNGLLDFLSENGGTFNGASQ